MIVVEIPKRRAYMHLDTLITRVDHHEALVFPPVILADGAERASVCEIDLYSPDFKTQTRTNLLSALKARGIDLEPIPCGGPTRFSSSASNGPTAPTRSRSPRGSSRSTTATSERRRSCRGTAIAWWTRRICCWDAPRWTSTTTRGCA